jgi:hypothetical protein
LRWQDQSKRGGFCRPEIANIISGWATEGDWIRLILLFEALLGRPGKCTEEEFDPGDRLAHLVRARTYKSGTQTMMWSLWISATAVADEDDLPGRDELNAMDLMEILGLTAKSWGKSPLLPYALKCGFLRVPRG